MGLQIILVLESDEKSKSDYIYISSILNEWYDILSNNNIRISKVFMKGKGNYQKKSIKNKIDSFKKAYQNGESYVIYCFDTDSFESNPNDYETLQEEQKYCRDKGYKLVWFCHDIEEVFLGKSVPKHEKTSLAMKYSSNNGIKKLKKSQFKYNTMSKNKSNLVLVLDDIIKKMND